MGTTSKKKPATTRRPVGRRLDQIDLRREWELFHRSRYYSYGFDALRRFTEYVQSKTYERPKLVEQSIVLCHDCGLPTWKGQVRENSDGNLVCSAGIGGGNPYPCWTYYAECEDCHEWTRYFQNTTTNQRLCRTCVQENGNWTYCDHCGYHPAGDDEALHNHGGPGCKCESPEPARSFTIRNDGEPALANDTRVTVTLPAGVISAEGMQAIFTLLHSAGYKTADRTERSNFWALAGRLEEVGNTWQTRQGNFTKRLSRFAYNEYKLKVPPEVISEIGCIARDHSTAIDFAIEVTRNLNLSPEEFAHEDSCWWQSYASSRCALKSNGGFGLRTFEGDDDDDCAEVTGRAWVMPLKKSASGSLEPTFETQNPDAFVVFNGYGDLSGYAAARIISHMAGMTYRKVGFACPPMYVNNESGYLVAPEEIATDYTDGHLRLDVEVHSNLFNTESAEETANAA